MESLPSEVLERLERREDGQPATVTRFRLELVREPAWREESPIRCSRPAATAELLHRILEGLDREVFGALFLDARNGLLGVTIAYVGTLTRTSVEPRGVVVPALLANAAGLILFHNHPTGDPTPSPEDLAFTRRLKEAAELVSLKLVDHLIIGERPSFVSLCERGGL